MRWERFRIGSGPDADREWRDVLYHYLVDDLRRVPGFIRHARLPDFDRDEPQPALVIPLKTTVRDAANLFGWPSGTGDHNFSTTNFATKIHTVAIGFKNLAAAQLKRGPYVYFFPVGRDFLRYPAGGARGNSGIRSWNILDQKLPPIALGSGRPGESWASLDKTLATERRRYAEFRAFGIRDVDELGRKYEAHNASLIGRSVWNSEWLLIIRGKELLGDSPRKGLERFISHVSDIVLSLKTYAHSGN